MIMFKVNNIDFSNHVIAGTYAVNTTEKYNTWTDANYHTHKQVLRTITKGSFDVYFKTMEEYNAFSSAIRASKTANGDSCISATVVDNISNQEVTGRFYVEYTPIRDRDSKWRDYYKQFTIKLEEY